MSYRITVEQLESGSTAVFLRLGTALSAGGEGVTERHLTALTAALIASESMDSRVYFSPAKGQFVYLPPLEGPPLLAGLYAFSRALSCKPFSGAMREVLKKWVDGNPREMALAMVLLKWGADEKSSSSAAPPLIETRPTAVPGTTAPADSPIPETSLLLHLQEISHRLRDRDPAVRGPALDQLQRVAGLDGEALQPLLPALVNGLAEEFRDRVLAVLEAAVRTGLDARRAVPVLAGLLLDRDYYDDETVGALYRCLIAVAEAGQDISAAWPYVPLCMEVGDLRLRLLRTGAISGLPIADTVPLLLDVLRISVMPDKAGAKEDFSGMLSRAALALEILSIGVQREELGPELVDGARDESV